MTWTAQFSGPGGLSASEATPTWAEAANWLRGMMDSARPPVAYEEAVASLRNAAVDQPVTIAAGRYAFALTRKSGIMRFGA